MKQRLQHLNNSRIVNGLKVTIFAACSLAYIIWALPFFSKLVAESRIKLTKRRHNSMAIRNKTIRKLPKASRKLARLINELDSTLTRLKHFLPDVETLEHDSNALYNRMSSYEKKAFAQEQATEAVISTTEGAEIPHTDGSDSLTDGPLFNQGEQKELSTAEDKPDEPKP